jgi:hypothetical protein
VVDFMSRNIDDRAEFVKSSRQRSPERVSVTDQNRTAVRDRTLRVGRVQMFYEREDSEEIELGSSGHINLEPSSFHLDGTPIDYCLTIEGEECWFATAFLTPFELGLLVQEIRGMVGRR